MCMYQNLPRVSAGCQSAVLDLYQIRDQYYREEQAQENGHPHFGGVFFLLLGVVALFAYLRRRAFKKHMKPQINKANNFMDAIRTNPELCKNIEEQTGLTVPNKIECPQKKKCSSTDSCCVHVCKFTAYFAGIVLVSTFIAITSLNITCILVQYLNNHMESEEVKDENGNPVYTSAFTALLILFLICTIQISIFVLIVKAVKLYFLQLEVNSYNNNNNGNTGNNGNTTNTVPSAPVMRDTATNSDGSVMNYMRRTYSQLPNISFFGTRRNNTMATEYYIPLMDTEENLIDATPTVVNPPPRFGVLLPGMQSNSNNGALFVPVTANPVSSVSFY